MAEEVINCLENMKLIADEEVTITISDEGRRLEIESCTLSLIEKKAETGEGQGFRLTSQFSGSAAEEGSNENPRATERWVEINARDSGEVTDITLQKPVINAITVTTKETTGGVQGELNNKMEEKSGSMTAHETDVIKAGVTHEEVSEEVTTMDSADTNMQIVDGPWVSIGDFNAILKSTEKLSKRPPQHNQMDAFREALDHCQLEDLGFRGYQYTWNNKRPGDVNTRQRLDRATTTSDWRMKFLSSIVTHLSTHASDHLPILLHVLSSKHVQGRRRFHFEELWLLHEECENVIKSAWEGGGTDPFTLELLRQKLADCAADLHAWGSSKT
uniref:Uncharacterized protein n=1 Tax=Quercus lobata TaxID=97700 RepID=A0A7N2LBU5_QUELO